MPSQGGRRTHSTNDRDSRNVGLSLASHSTTPGPSLFIPERSLIIPALPVSWEQVKVNVTKEIRKKYHPVILNGDLPVWEGKCLFRNI